MKRVNIEMVNEELSGGSNAEIGVMLEDILTRSFHWWHDHVGEKDRILLHRWRILSIEVKESEPEKT